MAGSDPLWVPCSRPREHGVPRLQDSLGHAHEDVSMAPKSLEYHHLRCNTWGRGGDQRGVSFYQRLLELGERLETIEAVKAGRTSHHSGIRLLPDGRKVGRGGVSAVVTEHNCHSAHPRRPCRQPTLTLSFRKQPSSLR